MHTLSLLIIVTLLATSTRADKWCASTTPTEGDNVKVPDGWCIRKYATLQTPRVMEFAPNGDIFVASPQRATPGAAPVGLGGIYVLHDDDLDGVPEKADEPDLLAYFDDVATTHGLKFVGNELLYTTEDAVWALPYTKGDRKRVANATPRKVADLSSGSGSDRWTHTLAHDKKNDKLYVSTGRYDGNCQSENPRVGAVLRIGEGEPLQGTPIVTRCRNPMYTKCKGFGCYAIELSGDGWGPQSGTEKLVELKENTDIGYPCCVQPNQPTIGVSPTPDCSGVTPHLHDFVLTSTPFGFDWDEYKELPAPYTGRMFIAMHGAFISWRYAGLFTLAWDYNANKPVGDVENFFPFEKSFGQNGILGNRVSDVKIHPDGRIFFCDDDSGNVYWIAPESLEKRSVDTIPDRTAPPTGAPATTTTTTTTTITTTRTTKTSAGPSGSTTANASESTANASSGPVTTHANDAMCAMETETCSDTTVIRKVWRNGECQFVDKCPSAPAAVGCTEEAKVCPDGSTVARVGPDCKFTPCPSSSASNTAVSVGIAMLVLLVAVFSI